MKHKKTLIIVGNADITHDLGATIDAADEVWRFNAPRHVEGRSGQKITRLYLCNSGKPMQLKLDDQSYLQSPFFKAVNDLVFVYHPSIMRHYFKKPPLTARLLHHRKIDWTIEGIDAFGQLGKAITVLPPQFYLAACRDIGITDSALYQKFPSTGYLALWFAVENLPHEEWDIKLCGFGFEGWKRHQWDAEREWVGARIEEGLLSLLDVVS